MKNIKTFEGSFDIKKFENWSDSDGLDISNLKMEVYMTVQRKHRSL